MVKGAFRALIVGGYGHVGTLIARELVGREGVALRLAGPALKKAPENRLDFSRRDDRPGNRRTDVPRPGSVDINQSVPKKLEDQSQWAKTAASRRRKWPAVSARVSLMLLIQVKVHPAPYRDDRDDQWQG